MIQIIRYEDMSMEPIDQTNRIYDFIGMKISPEIEEFLKKSTTTQDLESNHRSDQKFMQIYTTSVSYLSVFLTSPEPTMIESFLRTIRCSEEKMISRTIAVSFY